MSKLDAEYVKMFARRVGELFTKCPIAEQQAIAEHACQKHSGRIGRSAGAKELQVNAVELAVRAHARHADTRYNELLAHGVGRTEARDRIAADVAILPDQWQRGNP